MVAVTSDGLPVGAEPQISEDLRQRGIVVVQGLFANGKVDQDAFQRALDKLLAVQSEAEFATLMRSLPLPVAVTPPALRRQEPLEIATSMGGPPRWSLAGRAPDEDRHRHRGRHC